MHEERDVVMSRMNGIESNTVPASDQLKNDQMIRMDTVSHAHHRILIVGNSITRHAPKPDIGWENDWGMAASSEANDYVHVLQRKVRSECRETSFCIAQLADWERQYWKSSELLESYRAAAQFNPSMIVMRLAENVPAQEYDREPFGPYYEQLIDYLNPKQDAQVIVTTSFWPSQVDDEIRRIARKRGYSLVELGELGQKIEYSAAGLFEHSGVAAHPGDRGMAAIADAIWEKLEPILKAREVSGNEPRC